MSLNDSLVPKQKLPLHLLNPKSSRILPDHDTMIAMKPFDITQGKRFIVIDGNAILHRAYHALPPLTNKEGIVVNAVYGFCSMLLKVIADLKPDYLAVAFDRAAPTFRQELYVGYQAHRPKMADDLSAQIVMVHEVLSKMKISVFEIDGYEADDIIGTIAHKVSEGTKILSDKDIKEKSPSILISQYPNIDVIIVSGDRDMLQLVNGNVKVYAPIIGLTKTILFDAKTVEEKYAVKPSQIIDYKALIGDASDNYPGVSGIGPKTASELLRQYKTLENLYENIGKLSAKIGERLATDIEQASLAKKLATIATDCPISLDIEKCSMKYFDTAGARTAFEDLGFQSLVKRVERARVEEVDKVEKGEKKSRGAGSGSAREDEQLGLL